MHEQRISKQRLGEEVGYSRQQISDVLKGKSNASEKLQNLIAKAFSYSLVDMEAYGKGLLAGEEVSPQFPAYCTITRKIVGLSEDGNLDIDEKGADGFIQRDMLESLSLSPANLGQYTVTDDSLAPYVGKRSTVYVDLSNEAIQSGASYLVRIGQELTLRVIESLPEGLRVSTRQPNIAPLIVSGKDAPGFRVFGPVVIVFQAAPIF